MYKIQISSSLVNQLVNDGDKSKKKTKKPKPKLPQNPPRSQPKPLPIDSELHTGTPTLGWPLQPPLFLPTSPPPPPPPPPPLPHSVDSKLESIRTVLQQSEKVLDKLQKQEEDMLKEVTERAKILHDKEFKLPEQKPVHCLAAKDACLECYTQYSKDPLKCADVAKSYKDCVRKARYQAMK